MRVGDHGALEVQLPAQQVVQDRRRLRGDPAPVQRRVERVRAHDQRRAGADRGRRTAAGRCPPARRAGRGWSRTCRRCSRSPGPARGSAWRWRPPARARARAWTAAVSSATAAAAAREGAPGHHRAQRVRPRRPPAPGSRSPRPRAAPRAASRAAAVTASREPSRRLRRPRAARTAACGCRRPPGRWPPAPRRRPRAGARRSAARSEAASGAFLANRITPVPSPLRRRRTM